MQCPNCGQENPAGARFCFSCGTPFETAAAREERKVTDVAIVRLEQFYPFPATRLADIFASYPNAAEIFWTQEEPMNMGAWQFMAVNLPEELPEGRTLRRVSRRASASPAVGSAKVHEVEQRQLVAEAFSD